MTAGRRPAAPAALLAAALIFVGLIWLASGCSGRTVSPSTSAPALSVTTTTEAPPTTAAPETTAVSVTAPPATQPITTTTTEAPSTTSTTAVFDASRAMGHIRKLSVDIGVRQAGTDAELEAAEYGHHFLEGLGYAVEVAAVPLPNGRTSHNVIAVKQGTSPLSILVGGHIDSWGPSPGANDNASGAATVLELARDLKDTRLIPTIVFVLFGDEEMIDEDPDHHHYGSRAYVAQMPADTRATLAGMISLDMLAYGTDFTMRTMGKGPQEMRSLLKTYAAETKTRLTYARDPSSVGWSDHEPFELAGFPAVWIEWRLDGTHHTAADDYDHLSEKRLRQSGDFVLGFLRQLDSSDLDLLASARTGVAAGE